MAQWIAEAMSDDNGQTWNGPESLHGAMHPGTDAGYDDLKRTVDGTFEAVTSFATRGLRWPIPQEERGGEGLAIDLSPGGGVDQENEPIPFSTV